MPCLCLQCCPQLATSRTLWDWHSSAAKMRIHYTASILMITSYKYEIIMCITGNHIQLMDDIMRSIHHVSIIDYTRPSCSPIYVIANRTDFMSGNRVANNKCHSLVAPADEAVRRRLCLGHHDEPLAERSDSPVRLQRRPSRPARRPLVIRQHQQQPLLQLQEPRLQQCWLPPTHLQVDFRRTQPLRVRRETQF